MPLTPRTPPSTTPEPASLAAEIRNVVGALRRRWLWIAFAAAAALTAAVLFLLLVTPRYVASAQILIDPRAKRIVEGAVVPGGFGSSAAGADTLLVDSQVELMQSSAVLRRIVETEKLHEDPEFAVPPSRGGIRILLRNTIGRALFGNAREEPPQTDAIDTAVWRFADKHLRVRRLGNTYVISVGVMSQDPQKAARLANAVAQAYIRDQVKATTDTTRDATSALQGRIDELRKKVETAENAVEAFRSQAGLIGAPNLLVTEQQLQQTNDRLISARTQTGLAKARYDQVKDLNARAGAAALGAQSDALRSNVIANLRATLSRVERREAVVQQTLRPGHPEYANVQVEKRAVLGQIDDELARIKANAKAEYDLAQNNERALAAELKTLEGRTAAGNQAQVRLRELQREAQSSRAIFEQFLNRSKETSEQETLGRDNSRIISAATVPPYPAFPPTFLLLVGSLLAGLGIGALAAWLAYVFSQSLDPVATFTPAAAAAAAPAPVQPRSVPPQASMVPRARLRKMLAPLATTARPSASSPSTVATGPRPTAAPRIETPVAGKGSQKLETLARLPAVVAADRNASGQPSLLDHIAAVDDASAAGYPGYRAAIDHIIQTLSADPATASGTGGLTCLLVGAEPAAGTTSTALALAYRAATTGRRTLLIDACPSDPRLSSVFAAKLKQRRPCVLDSEAHLAEITLHDSRTGLSMLPIALADLALLDAGQQRRLLVGLRQLKRRFDVVVIDVGSATENSSMAFLTDIADRVLVVTPESPQAAGVTRLRALEAARRFASRRQGATIVETAAA